MPAIMDDPATPTLYRRSGLEPFPDEHSPLPSSIEPIVVTLRDRITTATILPFRAKEQVPESLLIYLCDQFGTEIEAGDTYPMLEPMPFDQWRHYWFQNFAAIMLVGNISTADMLGDRDWEKECLGSFYVKPNYTGRSSHVCNAGFLVCKAARNKGVGRLLGEAYLDWAPKLGYTYSVFNLVYETNVASCRIWDGLGFKRIGRVKGCGNLKSYPGQLIDAIIYGRELGEGAADNDDIEERFDKIRFYLKTGKYPSTADRAEKSRLRSAATHYRLVTEGEGENADEKLYLKDKEVISDPQRQYDISKATHETEQHAGINKSTAAVSLRYHWVRIKETVSAVIKNCEQCGELAARAAQKKESSRVQESQTQAQFAASLNGAFDASMGSADMQDVAAASSAAAAAAAAAAATTSMSTSHLQQQAQADNAAAASAVVPGVAPVANMAPTPSREQEDEEMREAPDLPTPQQSRRGKRKGVGSAEQVLQPQSQTPAGNIDPMLTDDENDLRRRLLAAGFSGREGRQ